MLLIKFRNLQLMLGRRYILPVFYFVCISFTTVAQQSVNDTIRLGSITVDGKAYPMAFLEEYIVLAAYLKPEDQLRRNRLRRDVHIVYPYAITAAAILRDVHKTLNTLDKRKERRQYLKQVDKQLDVAFKQPLKNLTVDQGHVLIKLINRQTGQDCYSIIRELKGGFSAVMWQSVGVMFNNNLRRDYDPSGADRELEQMVQLLESSNYYKYHLYVQQEMMKKVPAIVK